MQIKTIKLSGFDGMELKEATFRKQTFPEHFHDSYSIGIIEQGIERLSFAGKEVLAHANAVTIINPYDIHANRYFDNDSWKYRAVYVSTDIMRYVQQKTGLFKGSDIWFPKQLIEDPYLYRMILDFHAHGYNKAGSLDKLLIYLIHQYADRRPEDDSISGAITDAANYIAGHFTDKLTIDDMAARYRMDKYKFIRLFKKQTGLTPVSYLLLHRINRSKALISMDMPMTSVALETGFYDQSHFTHYFKRYIGIAPLSYKKGIFTAS